MEELKPETQKLLQRMEECSKLPYRFDEPKIKGLIRQIWDLTNTPQPKEIVFCEDTFDSRLQEASAIARASASASARARARARASAIARASASASARASASASASASAIARASASASASASARARASAIASASASARASDYDFDWFCGEVELGVEGNQKYIEIMELLLQAKEAGLGYLMDNPDTNILYIAPNPVVKIENNQFHSDQLPAIEYATWKGYFLDGVHFEKELWQKVISHTMSFKEIMAIEISDQRTVALKYNPQAILNEGAELVHKDHRNNELYLIEGKGINKELDEQKIWFLKMLCPTGRTFVESCDPSVVESMGANATKLQAFACGLTEEEYISPYFKES